MIDSIPAWLAAPLIALGGLYALYVLYIAPGYARDKAEARDS